MPRDKTAGPDSGPEPPFPIRLSGRIVKGFGRGSKELGIPTANIPIGGLDIGGHTNIDSGIYFGWIGLNLEGAVRDSSHAAAPPAPPERHDTQQQQQPSFSSSSSGANGQTGQDTSGDDAVKVLPAVLSIGYNPYYKNEVRSVEVHIINEFKEDFYNAMMTLSIMGFIRPEQDYDSMQALVDDIKTDIEVAKRSLERSAYMEGANDPFLLDFEWGKSSGG